MFGQILKGKTALVTGSVSGIGLGIARSLSAAGSNIILNGFGPEDEIRKIEKQLTTEVGKAKFIHADLSRGAEGKKLVEDSIKHFGQVDILVNNAGIQHVESVEEFPDEKWEQIIAINLSSNFYTMKAALPAMKAKGWGRVINISSVHGLIGSVNKSAYIAAKHGVVGLTRGAALESAKTGVTCNCICPGFVLTELVKKQIVAFQEKAGIKTFEAASKEFIEAKQPTGSYSTPDDIGQLAIYLCTHPARQITGASYTVDGGWTTQ